MWRRSWRTLLGFYGVSTRCLSVLASTVRGFRVAPEVGGGRPLISVTREAWRARCEEVCIDMQYGVGSDAACPGVSLPMEYVC